MVTLRDSLNKMEGQKLEQKSESAQIPSYLPSAICRYKKLGHLRFACSILKKKKEKKKNDLAIGVTKH